MHEIEIPDDLSAERPPLLPAAPAGWPRPEAVAPSFYFIDDRRAGGRAHGGPGPAAAPGQRFDVESIRRDFPMLRERVNGRPLVWLDNAATTHKPQAVIDRLAHFYCHENSNVHRGAHTLASQATQAYEDARAAVARYLGAPSSEGIVFTRGTTEAINLVAQTWGRENIGPGDEIVLSHLEHHANIVPWQQLADRTGARLLVIDVHDDGQLDLGSYHGLLSERTRLVAVAHVSNVLGTVLPVGQIVRDAHHAGARVLIDGAQAVAHMPVDVAAIGADFYVFSGHKIFGPTGIGALYAMPDLLQQMPPWQGGGSMIKDVTFEVTRYEREAGQVRGGHRQHRRRRRSRRRSRLRHRARPPGDRGLRASAARLRSQADQRDTWPSAGGHRPGEGEHAHVRARRLPTRRGRGRPRLDGHRGQVRAPLRPADPAPVRARGGGAPVAGHVQHLRRGRQACRGLVQDRRGPPPAIPVTTAGAARRTPAAA